MSKKAKNGRQVLLKLTRVRHWRMCLPLLLGICLSLTVLVFALQSGIVTFLMAVLISIFILAIGIWLIDLHSQGYFHWMFYRLTEPSGDRMPANWDGTVKE